MVDAVSLNKRSQMMARIKGKDSLPEILVRKALYAKGYRFRLHRRDLPGSPDIVLPKRKIAIFVHGCFWHAHQRCKYAKTPSTRVEFWSSKLLANVERDQRTSSELMDMGWRVLVVWECATRTRSLANQLADAIDNWIQGESRLGEITGRSVY